MKKHIYPLRLILSLCALFFISLSYAQPNDLCANATPLANCLVTGSTVGSTAAGIGPQNCGIGVAMEGVWFVVTGTGTSFTATTIHPNTDFDTQLWVWSTPGGCAGPLTCVTYNDDSGFTLQSTVTFNTILGTTYYIYLEGFSGATGNYGIIPNPTPPNALCQDATVQLNANGMGLLFPANIDNGSNDNGCPLPAFPLSLSQTNFDCTHLGTNPVTLTVTNNAGLSSTCMATVTVEDNVNPQVTCMNATVQLDANGMGSLNAIDAVAATIEACGPVTYTPSIMDFTCANLGNNIVNIEATDPSNNMGFCNAVIMVEDNIDPVVNCMNTTIILDANGNGNVVPANINAGANDNCFINSIQILGNATFNCSNIGQNTVTLQAADLSGNTNTCNATVTVMDITPPNALCQNATAILDGFGMATITTADIDNGSNDACGIQSLSLSNTAFTCNNLGPNLVSLFVTDVNGNFNSCQATVNVVDDMAPYVLCRPPINTVNDAGVCGKTNLIMLDPIVLAENCGIASITNNAPANFPIGQTVVTWTVTDIAGNPSTCTQNVTINDTEAPQIECGNSFIAYTSWYNCGYPSYLLEEPWSVTDNCGIASVTSDAPGFFPPGDYMVNYTATDIYGNTSTCMQWVKIFDILAPHVTYCPEDVTVEATQTDGSAQAYFGNALGEDNCGISFISSTHDSGDYFPLGVTEVTFTIYDNSGNPAECSFNVTVTPVQPVQNLTVDCIADLEISVDGTINFEDIAWNNPLVQSLCPSCDVIESNDLEHLGFFQGSQYYIYTANEVTYSQANAIANWFGGNMVVVGDEKHNDFLSNELPVAGAYIGLIDNTGNGNLFWSNGDAFEMEDWNENNDLTSNTQSVVVLNEDGTWTIQAQNDPSYFIFEVPCFDIQVVSDDMPEIMFAGMESTVSYAIADQCGNVEFCDFNIVLTEAAVAYCEGAGVETEEEAEAENHHFIDKFGIDAYQNASGNDHGYGDYTDQTIALSPGEVVNLNSKFGPEEMDKPLYCRIWMDLNGDGDFYDEGELLMQAIDELTMEGEMEVPYPTNVFLEKTRMRVAISRFSYPEPCGNFDNGETEDYTVEFDYGHMGLHMNVTLDGYRSGTASQLRWLTNTNIKIDHYEFEHSVDGINFTKVGNVEDNTNMNMSKTYAYADQQPAKGNNFYRVYVVPAEADPFYTNIVQLEFGISPSDIVLLPNPADERVFISAKELAGRKATINIYNSLGIKVMEKEINKISLSDMPINLNNFVDGLYQMQIVLEGQRPITKSFVVDKLNGYRPASY